MRIIWRDKTHNRILRSSNKVTDMSAILFSYSYKYCKVESSFTKKAEEMLPVPHTCTVCLCLLCTGILEKTTAEPWLVGESEQLSPAFFLIPCVSPAECLWLIQAGRICAQLQQHWVCTAACHWIAWLLASRHSSIRSSRVWNRKLRQVEAVANNLWGRACWPRTRFRVWSPPPLPM